jgi:hypothetical protein
MSIDTLADIVRVLDLPIQIWKKIDHDKIELVASVTHRPSYIDLCRTCHCQYHIILTGIHFELWNGNFPLSNNRLIEEGDIIKIIVECSDAENPSS